MPEESKSGDFIFKGEDCRQVKNGEASKILHMGYHHNQDSEISHDDCSDYFHFDEFHILGRKKIITVRRINDYS